MKKFNAFLNKKQHWGIFLLRVFIGIRLVYGVTDNIASWEHMLEFAAFLGNYDFPLPLISAIVSVYAQFICGIFILIGFKIRLASLLMIFNFLAALLFVHIASGDSLEGMTPPLAMLFGCLTFLFTGAQKISVDERPGRKVI